MSTQGTEADIREMYMAKRKSKAKQTEIAEEAIEQQERKKLLRDIATLKRLPNDFRDITLGTDWESFADITGRRKEMDAWSNGPIVYLAPLNKNEKMILGSPNKLLPIKTTSIRSFQTMTIKVVMADDATVGALFNGSTWNAVLSWAAENAASWIYLPDEETPIVEALNTLFSRFGFNLRVKGQLMSAMTGKPVGVQY